VIQVRGERRHSEVIAAQADACRTGTQMMAHLVVIQLTHASADPRVSAALFGDGAHGIGRTGGATLVRHD
jgi:hypothetical protein